jgi:site-specific DNA-cytosine methylase
MRVLSLFDGCSMARVALERLGIECEYYASEIDKYATKVSEANYPGIIRLGDVTQAKGFSVDLLIGGSPCQGFSFAGKQLNFDDHRSKLFFEYVRLLKECKPKYFLLENVRMKQEHQDVISDLLGVKPIEINSGLVSAQNRKRLFWTNIPNVVQPEDKQLVIADIMESEVDDKYFYKKKSIEYMERGNEKWSQAGSRRADGYTMHPSKKSFCLTANFHKGVPYNYLDCIEMGHADEIEGHDFLKRVYHPHGKGPTLTAVCGGNQERKVTVDEKRWRKLTPVECERLQTLPDGYTSAVSDSQRYKMLGNGFTVDVIAHILKGMI